MTRKIIALVLAMLLCFGCALAEMNFTDMGGRAISLDKPAERIVALDAADCEILYALGAGDLLVGRGEYCNYPAEVTEVPAVSSGSETNLEQIIALQPDVVIMSIMAQTIEQEDMLEAAGVKVVVSNGQSIDSTFEDIRMIGRVCGRDAEAEALVADIQARLAKIGEKCENDGKTVYFEVSPLEWGLWTSGNNTFMDELAGICGLTNAFGDVEGWAEVSEEQVLARDPDYIVTVAMYYGEGPTPVEEIMGRPGWENLKAVANGHVFNADSDEISRPGPRLADAAEALCEFVYGE